MTGGQQAAANDGDAAKSGNGGIGTLGGVLSTLSGLAPFALQTLIPGGINFKAAFKGIRPEPINRVASVVPGV